MRSVLFAGLVAVSVSSAGPALSVPVQSPPDIQVMMTVYSKCGGPMAQDIRLTNRGTYTARGTITIKGVEAGADVAYELAGGEARTFKVRGKDDIRCVTALPDQALV